MPDFFAVDKTGIRNGWAVEERTIIQHAVLKQQMKSVHNAISAAELRTKDYISDSIIVALNNSEEGSMCYGCIYCGAMFYN